MSDSPPLLPPRVRPHLYTGVFGRRLFYYPETMSTNDIAVRFAKNGEPEGTVVYADHQRAGRGRGDHTWSSPPRRDLLFSLILRPPGEPREMLSVTLAVSVALSVALGKTLDADVAVKWPNDVLVAGRKIAGILAESGGSAGARYVVVGTGVNVNSDAADFGPELSGIAVSCRSLTGVEFDRAPLLADLLGSIESYYGRFAADGFGALRSAYEERLVQKGRDVEFEYDGERRVGVAAGVDEHGALRVDRPGGGEWVLHTGSAEVVS